MKMQSLKKFSDEFQYIKDENRVRTEWVKFAVKSGDVFPVY